MSNKIHNRSVRWSAVVLSLFMLLLAACSNNSAPTGSVSPSPSGSASSGSPTPAERKPFTYILQQPVKSIDPAKAVDETELLTVINTYDPLFYPDVDNNKMDPVPHVAESYTVSDDGKVYTIKIKEGIRFHSGNELKAADVAYSIKRSLALGQGNSWLWSSVLDADGVTAPDERTVVFSLKTPYAPFISSLTQLFVLDSAELVKHYAEGQYGEDQDYGEAYLSENTVGSGPYRIVSWDQQSEMKLASHPEYWRGWKDDQIKDITLKVVTEESTVKTLMVSGEAQMIHKVLTINAYQELATHDSIAVDSLPSAKLMYFPMNTQKAPTDDGKIREAISLAFDYDTALHAILGGATAAAGPVPLIVTGHDESIQPLSRNLERAKELVGESQYKGSELNVTFMYIADNVTQRQLAQLVQSNLKEIGITVELKPVTWTQITAASAKASTTENLTAITTSLSYPHQDAFLNGLYHPASHGNYNSMSWLDDAEITDLLERARTAPTQEEQAELYAQAQRQIATLYPAVYISNPNNTIAYSKQVTGYRYVGLMGYDLAFYNLRYAA
ncbi:ABC transporter substrate-binding protein [Cohnella hongkongensis]|uniref:ABC transporter substrate-binding protein n=1 Tax=Cohnella hongkongensis TaxID=178337 RepID=A0ABV9F6Z1_9BACL